MVSAWIEFSWPSSIEWNGDATIEAYLSYPRFLIGTIVWINISVLKNRTFDLNDFVSKCLQNFGLQKTTQKLLLFGNRLIAEETQSQSKMKVETMNCHRWNECLCGFLKSRLFWLYCFLPISLSLSFSSTICMAHSYDFIIIYLFSITIQFTWMRARLHDFYWFVFDFV